MASEIRVNKINSRTGVGTITLSPTGVDFTGIATVATLKATTGIVTSLTVTGNATVATLKATTGIVTSLTVTGNATVGDTVAITTVGDTTVRDLTVRTVTSSDQVISNRSGTSICFRAQSSGTDNFTVQADGKVNVSDNGKFTVGSGDDLEIYHDGSNSYVNDGGTGGLFIRAANQIGFRDAANSFANFANFVSGGAIDLYYNGSKKFETTASGVTVTGAFNVGSATSITSSSLKVNDVQYPDSGPLSNRNLIINGDFQVAQRATSATSNTYATVDRWKSTFSQTAGTQSQLAFTSGDPYDEGFRYAYRLQVTSTSTNASAYVQMQTHLEAQDIARSGWKYKDSNRSLSCSFWVRSSLAGTYNVQYRADDVGSFFFNRAFTVAANTWTKVTHTIPGHASLVFDNNVNSGLVIVIVAHYGTSHTSNSVSNNTWFSLSGGSYFPDYAQNFGNTANATFDVTGIQLEVGSKSTPFEHRSYADMLAKCQRYYYLHAAYTASGVNKSISQASAYHTSSAFGVVHFPSTMRAVPTLEVADVANAYRIFIGGSSANFNSFATQEAGENAFTLERGSLSMTTGNAGWFRLNDEPGGRIAFNAEI